MESVDLYSSGDNHSHYSFPRHYDQLFSHLFLIGTLLHDEKSATRSCSYFSLVFGRYGLGVKATTHFEHFVKSWFCLCMPIELGRESLAVWGKFF